MKKRILLHVLSGICFTIAFAIYIVCLWSSETFGVGLDEIIFTITSPLKGADGNVAAAAFSFCLPRIIALIAAYTVVAIIDVRLGVSVKLIVQLKKRSFKTDVRKLLRHALVIISVLSIFSSLMYVNNIYNLVYYIENQVNHTTIYDDYYVSPDSIDFTLQNKDGEYKNLLYIYLESLETTYASTEDGGKQNTNYIPYLSQLAKDNVSFSNSNLLGGFHNTIKTGFTMGALLSMTSGVPFAFPVGYNDMSSREFFASGLTTLGDILYDLGYNQEFLCGSDASFAGRDCYFKQHGNYEIFDLFTAREKGYIPEDYFEFWGYEDKYLYQIAKDELTRLSKEDKPFNLTMLTVDTHHVSGYLCSECTDEFATQTENVVRCADRQLGSFIDWCREQEFFKDTVIIITGDHPRMDTDMVENVDYFDRTIYNCFINSQAAPVSTANRIFTSLDIFPTTLSALGIKWNSSRLGLGTDMFSADSTLAEQLGYEYLDAELAKSSHYFKKFY